ncbi:hypothetical protein [Sphingomonas bacterium]|uniref:hypothetical protein n=1 Tax=Sphingomonas bacterium TaxID=1895847 RepID=UPI00349FFFF9
MLTSSAAGQLSCRVDNLSRMGCRALIQCRFARDAYLSITFPHTGPIGTSVAWSDGLRSGLEFRQPLHVAVLDDLLRLFDRPRSGADQDFVSLADWQG